MTGTMPVCYIVGKVIMQVDVGRPLSGDELRQLRKQQRAVPAPGIIACGIRTPENMGSILRVADSAGAKRVIFCGDESLPQQNKIRRISRSASQHLAIETITQQALLGRMAEFQPVLALEITDRSDSLYDLPLPRYPWVMLGSESGGIPVSLLSACQGAAHIPMYGELGSMNVSHALAVYLFEWHRQREAAG